MEHWEIFCQISNTIAWWFDWSLYNKQLKRRFGLSNFKLSGIKAIYNTPTPCVQALLVPWLGFLQTRPALSYAGKSRGLWSRLCQCSCLLRPYERFRYGKPCESSTKTWSIRCSWFCQSIMIRNRMQTVSLIATIRLKRSFIPVFHKELTILGPLFF